MVGNLILIILVGGKGVSTERWQEAAVVLKVQVRERERERERKSVCERM